MDKKAVLEQLSIFRKELELRDIRVAKLILFGSYATGAYREESDIDVIVISDSFREKSYWDRIELLADAIYEVFIPIEAIAMTQEEWDSGRSDFVEYSKNGEVIYAA